MNLYLMRHCHPEPGLPMNGARHLTPKGIDQAKEMAKFLTKEIGRVDITITSPFDRAIETARIMADALGCHIADTRMLEPDGKPEEMEAEIARLAQASQNVLVVGHDPSLNSLLSYMIHIYGDSTGEIRLEHGAIAWLKGSFDDQGTFAGALQWLVTPPLIARDEDEEEVLEAARQLASLIK